MATKSGKLGRAHQVAIALASSTAAFVNRPYYKALTSPHIAGGKATVAVRGEATVVGFSVGALLAFHS